MFQDPSGGARRVTRAVMCVRRRGDLITDAPAAPCDRFNSIQLYTNDLLMILSKMVCLYRAESQMESHSGRAKLALFGQQAAHGTTVLHPTVSDPAHTAATRPLLLLPIPSLLPFSVLRSKAVIQCVATGVPYRVVCTAV